MSNIYNRVFIQEREFDDFDIYTGSTTAKGVVQVL